MIKYDQRGYRFRERFLLLTDMAMYLFNGKTYKQNIRLPLGNTDFWITSDRHGIVIIRNSLELKKAKMTSSWSAGIIECCI